MAWVWGRSPQCGSGAKPLVGGKGVSPPPEADDILLLTDLILMLKMKTYAEKNGKIFTSNFFTLSMLADDF
jgi:hypothetical protein